MSSGADLAGFHLQGPLGSGGSGTVLLAREEGVLVALKLIDHSNRPEVDLDQVLREAMVSTLIRHPNLVPCLRCGATDQHLYLAYEYLPGGDTRCLVEEGGVLPEDRILDLMDQTLDGLTAIHSAGYIHGDIKPSNILVGVAGQARIGDFGTAALIDESLRDRQATPAFMAPEQATGEELTPRTDLYGVGATAYFWACGVPPYAGPTPMETIGRLLTAPLPEPRRQRPELSVGFGKLLHRLLQKAPADRPGSAAEARQMVARVRAGDPDPTAERLASGQAATDAPQRRRRWPLPLAILVLALVGLLLWRPGAAPAGAGGEAGVALGAPDEIHRLPWLGPAAPFSERGSVCYRDAGGTLILDGESSLAADGSPLAARIAASGDFRLDLQLRPLDLQQQGPATILLLGTSHSSCNLLIGQSLDRLEVRCRSTATNPDGTRPHLSVPGVFTGDGGTWVHLRVERLGTINRVFVDGTCVGTVEVPGGLDNWSREVVLTIGDATRGGFGWRGKAADLRYVVHPLPTVTGPP